jgi:hypothetical protein
MSSGPRLGLAVAAFAGRGTAGFLCTVRPDGRPHSAGVGAAFYDGDGATRWRF